MDHLHGSCHDEPLLTISYNKDWWVMGRCWSPSFDSPGKSNHGVSPPWRVPTTSWERAGVEMEPHNPKSQRLHFKQACYPGSALWQSQITCILAATCHNCHNSKYLPNQNVARYESKEICSSLKWLPNAGLQSGPFHPGASRKSSWPHLPGRRKPGKSLNPTRRHLGSNQRQPK